jgi:hypothetical protein
MGEAAGGAGGLSEGVSCDGCHLTERVEHGADGYRAVRRRDDDVRFGPLCDATASYFHRTGCSPAFTDSSICATCHQWSRPTPKGGELVVFGEYEEWKASGFSTGAASCTSCHMPGVSGAIAVGSAARERVADHGLLGNLTSLRGQGLGVRASIEPAGREHAVVRIELANDAAGHAVPTGLPEREVALVVRVLDKTGAENQRSEITYGRHLVDESGTRVPFYRAVREDADTRIKAGETRIERVKLDPRIGVVVEITVVWRPMAKELAARGDLPSAPEQIVKRLRVPVARVRQ